MNAAETLSDLKLTTQDTAAWGILLWTWTKAFSLRRPDRTTEHGLDEAFASAKSVSASVNEALPSLDTAGVDLVAAFQCSARLNNLWLLFSDCVVAFRQAKDELMLSVWQQLDDTELHTGMHLHPYLSDICMHLWMPARAQRVNYQDTCCEAMVSCIWPEISSLLLLSVQHYEDIEHNLLQCAVLDGRLTEQEKASILNMQMSNSLLQQCSPAMWRRLRKLGRADLPDLLHTGGVALPSAADKTVAVCFAQLLVCVQIAVSVQSMSPANFITYSFFVAYRVGGSCTNASPVP
jgi:hypothetical protein